MKAIGQHWMIEHTATASLQMQKLLVMRSPIGVPYLSVCRNIAHLPKSSIS